MNPLRTGYPEGYAWTTLTYLTCGTNWESGTFSIIKNIYSSRARFILLWDSWELLREMVLGDAVVVWVLCLLLLRGELEWWWSPVSEWTKEFE